MSAVRLAFRYAKSLIDLAKEQGKLEEVYQDAVYIKQVNDTSRDFYLMLKSPIINSDKKKAVIDEVLKGKVSDLTMAFVDLLVKKGRESYITEIDDAVIEQYKALKHIQTVSLKTASEISPKLVEQIKQKIAKGKDIDVDLNVEVDESLIGGFVLQYGDNRYDTSISKHLKNLKTQIYDDSYVIKY